MGPNPIWPTLSDIRSLKLNVIIDAEQDSEESRVHAIQQLVTFLRAAPTLYCLCLSIKPLLESFDVFKYDPEYDDFWTSRPYPKVMALFKV